MRFLIKFSKLDKHEKREWWLEKKRKAGPSLSQVLTGWWNSHHLGSAKTSASSSWEKGRQWGEQKECRKAQGTAVKKGKQESWSRSANYAAMQGKGGNVVFHWNWAFGRGSPGFGKEDTWRPLWFLRKATCTYSIPFTNHARDCDFSLCIFSGENAGPHNSISANCIGFSLNRKVESTSTHKKQLEQFKFKTDVLNLLTTLFVTTLGVIWAANRAGFTY